MALFVLCFLTVHGLIMLDGWTLIKV